MRYFYGTTVYLILNTTVCGLSYNMKWSWKKCNRILYWLWRILTQIQKKNIFPPKIEAGMFLSMFLFFLGFQPGCSYKRCSYKKKRFTKTHCWGVLKQNKSSKILNSSREHLRAADFSESSPDELSSLIGSLTSSLDTALKSLSKSSGRKE